MRLIESRWFIEVKEKRDSHPYPCGSDFYTREQAQGYLNNLKARKQYRKGTTFSIGRRETIEHIEIPETK